jgi:hypothetical protein
VIVERVKTEWGTRIEPRLDQNWSPLEKLAWHAAVARVDCGVEVTVTESEYSIQILGVWIRQRGYYDIAVRSSTCGPMNYHGAWDYINGIVAGANAVPVRPNTGDTS